MPSDATRSTPPGSIFTPPAQRSRYSQPNLPTLLVSYNDGRSASGSPDRRIRMSQPTLNSSFSGINFVGMNKGRLSFPSLRASGENYVNFRIEEERLSAPNVHSAGLPDQETRHSQHDPTHVLKRDPPHKRDRLSQPTLVTGDYYPGRGHQRLSQPCLSSAKDVQLMLNSPVKHKRFCPPSKVTQRDRLHQLDFGTSRSRYLKELSVDAAGKFNRDRFSIPELETANDLKLIAGTPKQRFSLDSSLNEPKRRSRLLPIASSPISENLVKNENEGKKAADGLESVLIASTTPVLPCVESVFNPVDASAVQTAAVTNSQVPHNQRMSVPDISTSSLRRLLDPPAKQRHSITGNLRQCLLPTMRKGKNKSDENLKKKLKTKDSDDSVNSLEAERDLEPFKNVQRHYSYTYESTGDFPYLAKESMSAVPRKKFLESNFDRNEQVITTVIEREVPMILTSPKSLNKATVYGSETPKWMRKYIDPDNDVAKIGRKNNSQSSRRKAWQNSNRDSIDSVDSDKEVGAPMKIEAQINSVISTATDGCKRITIPKSPSEVEKKLSPSIAKDAYVRIEANSKNNSEQNYKTTTETDWMEDNSRKLYGVECEESESDESTSI
ncbi:uncharacterized protein LOC105686231 [Athalia rosae]|uniref:uncharacterized protein LOC105686231 n=1 Tax=Athalia rosae TaxID=37344 RepID=UPI002033E797|nr:uncharacterized protein LOC105686231 [Athalia rosae]